MTDLETHSSELVPCRHKNMDIDDQHDKQRYQHTAKEIEIDHVVQGNHFLKKAFGHAFGTVASNGDVGVPTCATEAKSIY